MLRKRYEKGKDGIPRIKPKRRMRPYKSPLSELEGYPECDKASRILTGTLILFQEYPDLKPYAQAIFAKFVEQGFGKVAIYEGRCLISFEREDLIRQLMEMRKTKE